MSGRFSPPTISRYGRSSPAKASSRTGRPLFGVWLARNMQVIWPGTPRPPECRAGRASRASLGGSRLGDRHAVGDDRQLGPGKSHARGRCRNRPARARRCRWRARRRAPPAPRPASSRPAGERLEAIDLAAVRDLVEAMRRDDVRHAAAMQARATRSISSAGMGL